MVQLTDETKRREFYTWWSTLTREEQVGCWYDLDAMAHDDGGPRIEKTFRGQFAESLAATAAWIREQQEGKP